MNENEKNEQNAEKVGVTSTDLLVKEIYDEAIYYEGGRPSGFLVRVGDHLSGLSQKIKELSKGLDGTIDGLSCGEEETGVKKVSISDLENVKDEIDKLLN